MLIYIIRADASRPFRNGLRGPRYTVPLYGYYVSLDVFINILAYTNTQYTCRQTYTNTPVRQTPEAGEEEEEKKRTNQFMSGKRRTDTAHNGFRTQSKQHGERISRYSICVLFGSC